MTMPTKEAPQKKKTKAKKTKEQIAKEAIAKAAVKSYKHVAQTAIKRKKAPDTVFIKLDNDNMVKSIVPIYSGSEYKPEYVHLVYEYLKMCSDSLIRREKFYNVVFTNPKTGELMKNREDLPDVDRFAPVIRIPLIKGFIYWARMEKGVAMSLYKVESFRKQDPDFDEAIEFIKTASEAFMHDMSANKLGDSKFMMFSMVNNLGYKSQAQQAAEDNPNAGGVTNIFNQMHVFLKDKGFSTKDAEIVEEKDYTLEESIKSAQAYVRSTNSK